MGLLIEVKKAVKTIAAKSIIIAERHNDEQLESFRLRTCHNCELYLKEEDECGICRCIIAQKAKAKTNRTTRGTIEITHCPKGFWGDIDIVNYYKEQQKK